MASHVLLAMMGHVLKRAGGLFAKIHAARMGVAIDFSKLTSSKLDPSLLDRARATWLSRFQTEFRSVQIMTRFLTEVVGAGDPLDVYFGIVDSIEDEVRHTALCAELCTALGVEPRLPSPVELRDPEAFVRAPMPERALHTAITMLVVQETISVAFISDLQARCTEPTIRAVLDATLADEGEHEEFGWAYVEQSLRRFPSSTRAQWRMLVEKALEGHRREASRALVDVAPVRRTLDAFPDEKLVQLGLYSRERQALVFEKVQREVLEPKLRRLELWPS